MQTPLFFFGHPFMGVLDDHSASSCAPMVDNTFAYDFPTATANGKSFSDTAMAAGMITCSLMKSVNFCNPFVGNFGE